MLSSSKRISAGTHQTIAKLEEYSYFALSEVKRILDAAVANNQFGYIVTDKDVSDFLFRWRSPQGQLENPEHTALLKEVIDGRAATPTVKPNKSLIRLGPTPLRGLAVRHVGGLNWHHTSNRIMQSRTDFYHNLQQGIPCRGLAEAGSTQRV